MLGEVFGDRFVRASLFMNCYVRQIDGRFYQIWRVREGEDVPLGLVPAPVSGEDFQRSGLLDYATQGALGHPGDWDQGMDDVGVAVIVSVAEASETVQQVLHAVRRLECGDLIEAPEVRC